MKVWAARGVVLKVQEGRAGGQGINDYQDCFWSYLSWTRGSFFVACQQDFDMCKPAR